MAKYGFIVRNFYKSKFNYMSSFKYVSKIFEMVPFDFPNINVCQEIFLYTIFINF